VTDLVSGVLTRISEIERAATAAAREAQDGNWHHSGDAEDVYTDETGSVVVVGPWSCGLFAAGAHIAANDPNSILRLCRAHRQIVDMYVHAKQQPVAESVPHSKGRGLDHASAMGRLTTLGLVLEVLAVGLGVVEERGTE
jgi:hypothetical protein